MADPGTAVGVVSLGLQITQGLLEYYSNYKTYSDDIAHAVQRIKYLHETLAALEIPLQKLETRGDTVSERVRVSVRNCDHVLMKLDEVVRKCGEVPASQSVVTKMKMVEKRLVYPLRKGTLRDVSTWVDRAQNDLDTALHALQLKVSVESQEEMTRYAVSFDHRLAAIQFGQLNTMQSLHSLHQASNINAQQTHFVAQNLEGISLQQQQISQQMSTLMQITTAIANQKLLAPSTISQGMAAAEELATLKVPNYQNANIEPRQSFLYPPSFRPSNRCTCSNSLFNRKSVRWDRSLSLFWRSESTHDSWCPLSRTRQKSDSVGARIRYGASMFTYIVEFTLNSTRGAGGYSMSQGLNIRRVVPDTNPAFRLFDYYSSLWFESPEAVKRSLDQYLRDGIVSATDVNERGHTLSQVSHSFHIPTLHNKCRPRVAIYTSILRHSLHWGRYSTSSSS
ncbi:hypothetical protein DM02DRAFT_286359 [Periconia macrospinosa]|uniref:Fungal N-terminal domain-containing protein n=1 Tax=Periconia macrospinosa TaxID=97972 RepID=A0A2V1EE32_9PLEO|nr:hypothetical protein DM02DRAFT_286359 [Periconia macrospinosa]